jgi:hypothetical protein
MSFCGASQGTVLTSQAEDALTRGIAWTAATAAARTRIASRMLGMIVSQSGNRRRKFAL